MERDRDKCEREGEMKREERKGERDKMNICRAVSSSLVWIRVKMIGRMSLMN